MEGFAWFIIGFLLGILVTLIVPGLIRGKKPTTPTGPTAPEK